jgi:hypothetical protein
LNPATALAETQRSLAEESSELERFEDGLEASRAQEFVQQIVRFGIDGHGPLESAEELAATYLEDSRYRNHDDRIKSLIRWETSKNFGSGFVTGLGGLITMPVTVPAALGASWMIQARLVGAIAVINGYDVNDDRVRTMIAVSLVGDAGKEAVKRAGIDLSQRAGRAALAKLPGRALIEINKAVGFRLVTKAGSTGVVNITRGIPLLGGIVGGGVDAAMCRAVATAAERNFPRER